jgi:titin
VQAYSHTGLAAGTSYSYRILAYSDAGTSDPSNVATAVTLTVTTPPAAPTALAATPVSATQIALTWADNATDEDGYYVQRCSGAACNGFTQVAALAAGATSYTSGGLTAGTSYSFRVVAYNAGGSSGYSNVATAAIPAPPAAPTGLGATVNSSSQISLAWTDAATNEDGYYVERCSGAGCSSWAQIVTLGAGTTSYGSTGLTASTSYSFRVRAYNLGGTSAYAGPVSATTDAAATPPAAPTGLSATPTSGTAVNVAWTDVATNETGYEVQRCTGAGCTGFATLVNLGANASSYSNSGLTAGTTYRYRVRATNGAGSSAFAGPASATPPLPPAAPTGFATNAVSTTQINLSWADNATNELGYELERCTGATCTAYAALTTLPAGATSYQNTGLTASTTYRYRVRAVNVGGSSAYATATGVTLSPSTLPAAPSNLVATAASSSQINLTWSDNSTNETGFRVEICDGASCVDFVDIGTLAANLTAGSITGLNPSTLYRIRIRATNASGNSGYSNIASATTQASAPLKIRVVNNALSTLSLRDIVRLKLEPNENSFGDEDLLSDDRLTSCMNIEDVNYISNGTSQSFDQNIGSSYSVWIQMGVWQTDFFSCSTIPYVWTRLTSFVTSSNLRYAYVIANISGHTSGTVDFVVTGSYLNGTLRLSMQQNGTEFANIPFIVTP